MRRRLARAFWLLKGVAQRDFRAKAYLAQLYESTKSKQKIKKAIKWMEKELASDSDSDSQIAARWLESLNQKLDSIGG